MGGHIRSPPVNRYYFSIRLKRRRLDERKARIRAHEQTRDERFAPLLGLPLDRDLPIAFVARMSLSFPSS